MVRFSQPLTKVCAVIFITAGLLVSCGSTSTGVPWNDYAPEVRSRINSLASAKDCVGLQAEFDNADANNEATLARTGHNNAELMKYIDGLMRGAGCYG